MENLFDSELCTRCKGRGYCGKSCPIFAKIKEFLPKTKTHFSGSSPPEIFVGRFFYPNINTGILSPQEYGETESYSMPELWYKKNLSIKDILNLRGKLIYARFKSNVKDTRKKTKFLALMQEISMADKNIATEIFLKKPPRQSFEASRQTAILTNPAPLQNARLEENPHIPRKVDYLVSDTDVKAATAINELYKSNIPTSNIIKILSAGLLGTGLRRKLVPTRWSITATDDTISKLLLEKIKYYPEISEIMLFHGYYVGNHYEFLLLPDKFSFEVIEAYFSGSVWNPFSKKASIMQDYESFSGRKNYANNVTGAYYTARLALCEYLESKKKQASCLVMREEREEYNAPLGVGILRELSRDIFTKKPEIFNSIQEALQKAQTRLKLPIQTFTQKSWLLKEYGKQKRLTQFF
jgi:hypothetical protein